MVGWIIEHLRRTGVRPAIISRGYGRVSRGVRIVADTAEIREDAAGGGDEPVQLARRFPGVPVVVGEQRTAAAAVVLERFSPEIIVLDDAFQHRAIGRDLDIVVADGEEDLTAEALLPAGMRREPLAALARASVVVFSMPAGASGPAAGEANIRQWFTGEIVYCSRHCGGFTEWSGTAWDPAAAGQPACLLVSGIGKPERFERDMRSAGIRTAGHLRYRDHHRFSMADIRTMAARARGAGAACIVTTEKDLVRLMAVPGAQEVLARDLRVVAAVLTVRMLPAGRLEERIDACRRRDA